MKWYPVMKILAVTIVGMTLTGIPGLSFAVEEVSIEEIIVTARKKEESLQKVPVAVTVLSADDLEKRSIPDLLEVARFTPNMYITPIGTASPDQSSVFIRGVGNADSFVTTDPGVGTYVDGVFLGRAQGGILDILDIERIEVLRGPQGTLFGKNTTGGAINVVSNAPEGDLNGKLSLTFGNLERVDVAGTIDLPIIQDILNVKLSALMKNRDCLFNRPSDNACYGDENTKAYRAFLRYTPTNNFTADIIFDGTHRDAHIIPSSNIRFGLSNADGSPTLVEAFNIGVRLGVIRGPELINTTFPNNSENPYAQEGNEPTDAKTDLYGISGHLKWEVGRMTLHSITAYRDIESFAPENTDGSTADFAEVTSFNESEQFTQEFRVEGLLFDERLDYIGGFFYFHDEAITDEAALLFNEIETQDAIEALIGARLTPFRNIVDQTTDSYAVFGHVSYSLTDKLRVSAGGRFTHEEKEVLGARHVADVVENVAVSEFTAIRPITLEESWDATSYKFGVDYQLSDDIFAFANVSRGFRSGGFNGRASTAGQLNSPFNPEFVMSYELGVKSDLFDNRVRLNLTGFFTDYTDRQLTLLTTTVDPNSGIATFEPTTTNNGEAELIGFEAELIAVVTENLKLEAYAGYIDAEFTDDISKGKGEIVPLVPEWTAAIAGEYTLPLARLGDLSVRVDYNYRDDVAFHPQPTDISSENGFGLLNVRATFYSESGNWEIAAYGRNMTDKIYKYFAIDQLAGFGLSRASYSDPREYGITIKRRF